MISRSRSERRLARVWSSRSVAKGRAPVEMASEEPMAIELDGVRVATTMRTPGHDFELAVGFCHNEGLLGGHPVLNVRYCANGPAVESDFNIVSVSTGGSAPVPRARLTATTSSCGFCGSTEIEELAADLSPIDGPPLAWDLLAEAPSLMRNSQALFELTGAVHSAGLMETSGEVSLVREDIGRHNAVDKLCGRMLLDGRLPATGLGLVLSGRASFELAHKAWAAGFRAVVSVSAPTALAAEVADQAGIQLAGFARDGALTIYCEG